MIDLRFDGLDAHIARVDDVVVGPMREAADAGRPIDLRAYGLIGSTFAATLSFAAAYASQSVGRLGDEATGIRERLVDTQGAYRRMEADNAGLIAGIPVTGTQLGGPR